MADKQVKIVIEAVDNASGVLENISSQIEKLAGGSTIGKAVKGFDLLGKGLSNIILDPGVIRFTLLLIATTI